MGETRLVELESAISGLPGVLGCVILAAPDGNPSEIQAFARVGLDPDVVEGLIQAEVERQDLDAASLRVRVFELEAESLAADRKTLDRAAEVADLHTKLGPDPLEEGAGAPPWAGLAVRPVLQRVVLTASNVTNEAEVALEGHPGGPVVGAATGDKTEFGLGVLAEATLRACGQLVDSFDATVRGVSLVAVAGEQAVLVLLQLRPDQDLVGSALVRGGPVSEAAVRATLDALNRVLLRRP